jgi:hypothetical protein
MLAIQLLFWWKQPTSHRYAGLSCLLTCTSLMQRHQWFNLHLGAENRASHLSISLWQWTRQCVYSTSLVFVNQWSGFSSSIIRLLFICIINLVRVRRKQLKIAYTTGAKAVQKGSMGNRGGDANLKTINAATRATWLPNSSTYPSYVNVQMHMIFPHLFMPLIAAESRLKND